jgi:hypothetical protein
MNNALSPEIQILLHCAKNRFDPSGANQLETLIRKDIDWAYVLQLALAHRVMPIVYSALNSTCADAVPAPILERLRDYFYGNVGRNLFLTQKLLELLQVFDSHGIPAIPYKGPTLAALIYGDLALRQIGDLDILVRERDYERAQRLLISSHFRLTIEHDWEAEFTDESGRVAVDLHRRMTAREFSCPLTFKYLWPRLQPLAIAGTVVPSMCPEDTVLVLSIQVTKDRYPQLAKMCDMAELLRVHGRMSWPNALKRAKRLGCERIMLFGLCLTSNVLGTALPQEVVSELQFHAPVNQLVEHASDKVFQSSDTTVRERLTSRRFHWLIRERLRDKLYPSYLRYVHGVIVPCDLDRHFVSLPRRLSFLYYLLRPARLMGKYGLLFMRRTGFNVGRMSPAIFKDSVRNRAR